MDQVQRQSRSSAMDIIHVYLNENVQLVNWNWSELGLEHSHAAAFQSEILLKMTTRLNCRLICSICHLSACRGLVVRLVQVSGVSLRLARRDALGTRSHGTLCISSNNEVFGRFVRSSLKLFSLPLRHSLAQHRPRSVSCLESLSMTMPRCEIHGNDGPLVAFQKRVRREVHRCHGPTCKYRTMVLVGDDFVSAFRFSRCVGFLQGLWYGWVHCTLQVTPSSCQQFFFQLSTLNQSSSLQYASHHLCFRAQHWYSLFSQSWSDLLLFLTSVSAIVLNIHPARLFCNLVCFHCPAVAPRLPFTCSVLSLPPSVSLDSLRLALSDQSLFLHPLHFAFHTRSHLHSVCQETVYLSRCLSSFPFFEWAFRRRRRGNETSARPSDSSITPAKKTRRLSSLPAENFLVKFKNTRDGRVSTQHVFI